MQCRRDFGRPLAGEEQQIARKMIKENRCLNPDPVQSALPVAVLTNIGNIFQVIQPLCRVPWDATASAGAHHLFSALKKRTSLKRISRAP